MDLNLKGKVVAITGGTTGIGAEVALGFAREGCKVAVCGRSETKIKEFEEMFAREGFEALTCKTDVSVNEELKAFVTVVVEKFGRLDVFINNAGINFRKPFDTVTEEEWHRLVDINFKSVFYGTAYAAEEMRKTGGGVILNTSSFTSTIPTCGIALYSAVKAGVDQLTRVFAAELAADHIRVNSIQPGMVVTPLTRENCEKNNDKLVSAIAMKRLAYPKDIVPGYLFLASDQAEYIDGFTMQISGGKFASQNPHYSYRAEGETY